MIKPYMKMPMMTTTSENPRWSCAFNGMRNEIQCPHRPVQAEEVRSENSSDSFGGDQSSSPAVSAPMPQ